MASKQKVLSIQQNEKEEHVKFLSRYVFDPGAFVQEVLQVNDADPWKIKTLEKLLEKRFVAIRSGNGVGKTALLSWAIIWFLITRPMCKIPCTATSKTQLDVTLWAELFRWIQVSEYLKKRLSWTHEQIQVVGYEPAWFAVARTAVNSNGVVTEALQGFHAPHLLFVVDEASGVPDKAIDALESATTEENSFGILTSNPTRRSGTFFNAFNKDRKVWYNVHVRPEDSSRMSEEFKNRMIRKYGGKETNGYRIRVEGEFPSADATGLLSYEEYNDPAVQVRDHSLFDLLNVPGLRILSVDPAGSSPEADATTIGIRIGSYIPNILTFHGLKETELAEQIRRNVQKYSPDYIVVDSIGLGAAICVLLEEQYSGENDPKIIRVNVGMTATNNVDFMNKRAEFYWHAAEAIKKKTIHILDDIPFLETDLTELHTGYTAKRKFQIESKDAFRERNEGRSTDFGDAFSLLFYFDASEGIEETDGATFLDLNSALSMLSQNNSLQSSSRWKPQQEEIY